MHREVDMSAGLTARNAHLWNPKADPTALAGHDPGHSTAFPTFDDRQAQDFTAEPLCGR